ncbi:hypothetical protein ACSQ67_016796 [Phaseolus vulgaris]
MGVIDRPSGKCAFAAFTTSYKNFKERYFKIFVEPDGREYFYNDGVTKFPFHWTRNPTVLNASSRMAPSALDKAVMVVFDQLPHKLPTREIISLYASSDPQADFIEIMSRADASLHEYMNKLRRSGDGRSASIGTAGPLAAVPSTTVLRRGLRLLRRKGLGLRREFVRAEPGHPVRLRANAVGGRPGYSGSLAGGADRRRE